MLDDEMLEEDSQALRSSDSQGEGLEVERMHHSGSGVRRLLRSGVQMEGLRGECAGVNENELRMMTRKTEK